ncbi:MAG TPA: AMP-binding protein [Candidatus Faecousia faecavium]|nr:AMP-binding protein [Candidatus Faecousia faecavium]
MQLRRLNQTLSRAKRRGGIYAQYPDHIESLQDLQALPFTTAQMLSAGAGNFLLCSQSQVSRVISDSTSGTSGPAKRVFYTQNDLEHTVGFFAAGIGEMLHPGERCFIAFPFSGPFGLGDLIAQAVERLKGIPIRAGFGQSWERLCRLVRQSQPQTYIGFPTALLGLARVYGADFPIQRALVSADACPAGVMLALEKILESKLYPHYGSRECGLGGAITCPAFQGMHLRENHIIGEIVDADGIAVPEGGYGELVITTIGLEAMPLIRYRTGDYTRFLPPCPCGSVTRRIDTVSREPGSISMEALDSALFSLPGVIDYRARLDNRLLLDVRVSESGLEEIIRTKAAACCPGFSIRVQTTLFSYGDTPLYPGKRRILH